MCACFSFDSTVLFDKCAPAARLTVDRQPSTVDRGGKVREGIQVNRFPSTVDRRPPTVDRRQGR